MYFFLDEICNKVFFRGEFVFVVRIVFREYSSVDCVVFFCVLVNFYVNFSFVKLFMNFVNKF